MIKKINLLFFDKHEDPYKTVRFPGNHKGLYDLCVEREIPVKCIGRSGIKSRNYYQVPIEYIDSINKIHDEYIKVQNDIFLSHCEPVEGFPALYRKEENMYCYRGGFPDPTGIAPNWLYPIYHPHWGYWKGTYTAKYGYIDVRTITHNNSHVIIRLPSDWYLGYATGKGGNLVNCFEKHLTKIFELPLEKRIKVHYVRAAYPGEKGGCYE